MAGRHVSVNHHDPSDARMWRMAGFGSSWASRASGLGILCVFGLLAGLSRGGLDRVLTPVVGNTPIASHRRRRAQHRCLGTPRERESKTWQGPSRDPAKGRLDQYLKGQPAPGSLERGMTRRVPLRPQVTSECRRLDPANRPRRRNLRTGVHTRRKSAHEAESTQGRLGRAGSSQPTQDAIGRSARWPPRRANRVVHPTRCSARSGAID
jgi:hypothetical protein